MSELLLSEWLLSAGLVSTVITLALMASAKNVIRSAVDWFIFSGVTLFLSGVATLGINMAMNAEFLRQASAIKSNHYALEYFHGAVERFDLWHAINIAKIHSRSASQRERLVMTELQSSIPEEHPIHVEINDLMTQPLISLHDYETTLKKLLGVLAQEQQDLAAMRSVSLKNIVTRL